MGFHLSRKIQESIPFTFHSRGRLYRCRSQLSRIMVANLHGNLKTSAETDSTTSAKQVSERTPLLSSDYPTGTREVGRQNYATVTAAATATGATGPSQPAPTRSSVWSEGDMQEVPYFHDIDTPFCVTIRSHGQPTSLDQDTSPNIISELGSFLCDLWESITSQSNAGDLRSHIVSADGSSVY